LKVVISTAGRFHLFALARELDQRDCLERIYSGFVWSALARESVPRDKVTTFPWFRTPYMALARSPIAAPRAFSQWLETMSCVAQDAYVAGRLPDCDAFIGHDGAGLVTGREAKRRGLGYVADTGTTHVAFRAALLNQAVLKTRCVLPGRSSMPQCSTWSGRCQRKTSSAEPHARLRRPVTWAFAAPPPARFPPFCPSVPPNLPHPLQFRLFC